MSKKTGRNEQCPCGSGQKFKYCCISKEVRSREVKSAHVCQNCGNEMVADLSNDIANILACGEIPLKNFCKDNDIYLFSSIMTVGEGILFRERLQSGVLKKQEIVDSYKTRATLESTLALLNDARALHVAFDKRFDVLRDASEAHFNKKFTLSVPVLFAQIEGLLRETGGLLLAAKFRPTIPTLVWNERFQFSLTDSASYFNAFITKLFEGQSGESSFNRNAVLHGMNVQYDSEDWSIILLLAVLEIRLFLWFEKNTHSLFKTDV